jgi:Trypsin-like peptidase domain
MMPKFFEEQILFATIRIEAQDPRSGRTSVGTGFLMIEPIPGDAARSVAVLTTCRHVLFDGAGHVTFRCHKRVPANPAEVDLGVTVSIGPTLYSGAYHAHPNPEVDLAAINVSSIFESDPSLYFRYFPAGITADFASENLVPTREVLFVGYPLGLFDSRNNLPIVRFGRIATHPRVDFDGKPEFLIDAQVYPGSSGSPVFALIDNTYKFVGVVGKSHYREDFVRTLPVADRGVYQQFVGLGVVYKPTAVTELLQVVARERTSART